VHQWLHGTGCASGTHLDPGGHLPGVSGGVGLDGGPGTTMPGKL